MAIAFLLLWLPLLSSCEVPQVSAESRLFSSISLELLDVYTLPKDLEWADEPVGGLSAIAYDRQRDRLLALSDDRGEYFPAHFYTLKLGLDQQTPTRPTIQTVAVEAMTILLDPTGQPYERSSIDPEGLALSPDETVFIASEGRRGLDTDPVIAEFDRATGRWVRSLPLPERYLIGELTPEETEAVLAARTSSRNSAIVPEGMTNTKEVEALEKGVQKNFGFEALALQPVGFGSGMTEPIRLFAATESALVQDLDPNQINPTVRSRFLHYLIGEDQVSFIAEYMYELDPDPFGTVANGLSELLVLDSGGHFLGLERSFGLQGFKVKLFQLATGGATDISNRVTLTGDVSGISPIRKQLILDFNELAQTTDLDLDLYVDNLEGMTFGPRLPDGSESLLLISDNNFESYQSTQLWLFRLNRG